MLQIKGHCSFFGKTGFNIYSRGFFNALKKLSPSLKVRNFTDYKNEEFSDSDRQLVDEQTFYNLRDSVVLNVNPPWVFKQSVPSKGHINIVLNETDHFYFYDKYDGINIAYNIWETTQQPQKFFDKLLEFHRVWVPSEWQKDVMLKQNFPVGKIHVVPGGVDAEFIPIKKEKSDVIRFLIVGSWCFRKSTKKMIECFLETFKNTKNVELVLSVDNPFANDGLRTTENRLKHYGLMSDKIKIVNHTDRESYIKLIQSCDVFLACSRGEGWNLPLIEALACGKPSIFSDCSSHTEFGSEYPLKVKIIKEIPAVCKEEGVEFSGNYFEPNWGQFKKQLKDVKSNLLKYTTLHVSLSNVLREKFSWDNSAKRAMELIGEYSEKTVGKENEFYTSDNSTEALEFSDKSVNDFIYKEIFDYQIYNNIPEMKIKPNDVVMDIGAHIGIFSRYAALNGASRVISVEMNPKFFSCLRLNVRPEDDVFNCVLLDKVFTKFKIDNDILVQGFNLKHFYDGGLFEKLDFLKIDISGQELLLLESIDTSIFDVIKKISVKLYNISDEKKNNLVITMNKNGFKHFLNILIPNNTIQFLYFWK